jgi:hypothetical protein
LKELFWRVKTSQTIEGVFSESYDSFEKGRGLFKGLKPFQQLGSSFKRLKFLRGLFRRLKLFHQF